ncbi:tetraacyldisaccharide 4'-kinase [Orbaceae bacterium ac157xtp]
MIAKIWSGQSKLYLLLIPFSILYGVIVFLRRLFYRIGLFKSWKSPIPVVIVGNLSVGGNGKTPLVIYLIEQLKAQGLKVGVVSRGYGGKSNQYPIIVDDNSTADKVGDEPILIYQRTGVALAVSPVRKDAIQSLLAKHDLDVIITDDGLQHYALRRDIEIVVIDGKRGFGNGWFLPAGPMREAKKRLNSVDFIVINGETDKKLIQQPIYKMQLEPANAINLKTGESKSVQSLSNVCAMAGIGDPERFFNTLTNLNVNVIKHYPFADHQHFTKDLLNNLAKTDQILLMTEKDAVKCKSFAESNWWYLPVDAQLSKSFIIDLCNKIKELTKRI